MYYNERNTERINLNLHNRNFLLYLKHWRRRAGAGFVLIALHEQ